MASPTAILKGPLYLGKTSGSTQLLSTGNTTKITLVARDRRKDHPQHAEPRRRQP